jgi:imidazole glycerol phosphate synthase glutamine amidotransferase subunit
VSTPTVQEDPSRAGLRVVLVPTGTANLASVVGALCRLRVEACLAESARDVERATHVVLPGVGTLGAAMQQLRTAGLAEALGERARALRPMLCICLGMQILLEGSEESPGCAGLGVLPGIARRFSDERVRVPHIGWSPVSWGRGTDEVPAFIDGEAYFAHSFALREPVPGWRIASASHDGPFVAAAARGGVLACQFHPELSGPWGQSLIGAWLNTTHGEGR